MMHQKHQVCHAKTLQTNESQSSTPSNDTNVDITYAPWRNIVNPMESNPTFSSISNHDQPNSVA